MAAASAQFLSPTDVAFDRDGNLYIADTENHRVRRMTPDGRVETVAGSGDGPGFEGDGGPATAALLSTPISVAVDSQGNIYINDSGNIRIRRVSTTGIITTIAGGARCNFPAPPPEDVLATAFPLCDPRGIAVDAGGSVYIAEWDLDVILRVRPDGTIHTLVEFRQPTDVAVDEAGNVFIITDAIRTNSGPLHRFAPDGSLTDLGRGKHFPVIDQLALAGDGTIYVSHTRGSQVFRVDTDDTVTAIAGSPHNSGFSGDGGLATSALLDGPSGLAVGPAGAVYFADSNNGRIRKVTRLPDNLPLIAEGSILNAASFASDQTFAPDSWASLFGAQLTAALVVAETTLLPTSLGGTSVRIIDNAGGAHLAFLQFVAPNQINLLFPPGVALGQATIRVIRDGIESEAIPVEIVATASGLFSMNANGEGVAAGFALRQKQDGSQTVDPLFRGTPLLFGTVPIPLGPETEPLFLILFGTGIRGNAGLETVRLLVNGESIPVVFAGPQGEFDGLDQVNAGPLPRSLAAGGVVDIVLMIDGRASNTVTFEVF